MLSCCYKYKETEDINNKNKVGGILKNHLYSIIDVRQEGTTQLICLRNGWYSKDTIIYKGRWSTKPTPSDNSFWMDLNEFVQSFTKLYICRLYIKTKKLYIKNKWTTKVKELTSGTINPFRNNPQYLITVKSPCSLFVYLLQKGFKNQLPKKYQIGFYILKCPIEESMYFCFNEF